MIDLLLTIATGATAANPSELPAWMNKWLNVTEPWELWWIGLGLIAQMMFFGRWIIQWIASERRKESYMPEFFWWLSLFGATLLLVYFLVRREPVGTIGQLTGWIVYGRNLYLIRAKKRMIIEDIPHEQKKAAAET